MNAIFFKTTAKLSYDQKCFPFGDHTNVSHDLSLVQRLRYVHHSHASYTILVADY